MDSPHTPAASIPAPRNRPAAASRPRIALVGDRNPAVGAHPRLDALRDGLTDRAQLSWLPTEDIKRPEQLVDLDGIWVVPGSPYRSMTGALAAVRAARTHDIPFLGTCGGFQHALIDHARTYAGHADAGDVQYGTAEADAVITALSCSLVGERAPLHLTPGTVLAGVYREHPEPVELYHCNYGLNPARAREVLVAPLVVAARDEHGATRAIERPDLTFFLATLFQPELVSTPEQLHPLIEALLDAATRHSHQTRGGTASFHPGPRSAPSLAPAGEPS